MGALGAAADCAALSLYSSVLLKLYLDIFLHEASGKRQMAGWLLFFVWQYLSESGRYNEQITLCFTFASIVFTGMAAYTGNLESGWQMEASEQIRDNKKEIWISAVYEKGCLFFRVKNRYQGELRMSSSQKILSKKKEPGHGFGLHSMKKMAEKYGGSMEVKLEEEGIFLVELLICC